METLPATTTPTSPAVKPTFPDKMPTRVRKKAMLKALTASFGVVKMAADQVGIDRTTHYMWLEKDPKYKKAVKDLENIKKDFVENKLLKLIEGGNPQATIYAAETLLKDRGYVKRQEVTGKDGAPMEHQITHTVTFKNSKQSAEEDAKDEQD